MSETAPYHLHLARGPSAIARYVQAVDGVRLRMVLWPRQTTQGTVFLFQGMGDYAEKYGPAAQAFHQHGYTTVTLDWRGQGLSERLHSHCVHTRAFAEYARDVAAFLDVGRDLPKPWYIAAHSMGGAIALRRLMSPHPFQAVAFSAPMWRLRPMGTVGDVALRVAGTLPFGRETSLLYPRAPYMMLASFRRNVLTSDPVMWAELIRHAAEVPSLVNCGPTLGWAIESAAECRSLARMASPDLPCVTLVGAQEKLVDIRALRARMNTWPQGRLEVLAGARHELMRERPALRTQVFDTCATLFQS